MKKGYQIVIGAAVALALVGGGLAGRAMYVEHQRNQAAAEHAKQEKLMNDKVTSHADKTYPFISIGFILSLIHISDPMQIKPIEINGYWIRSCPIKRQSRSHRYSKQ